MGSGRVVCARVAILLVEAAYVVCLVGSARTLVALRD